MVWEGTLTGAYVGAYVSGFPFLLCGKCHVLLPALLHAAIRNAVGHTWECVSPTVPLIVSGTPAIRLYCTRQCESAFPEVAPSILAGCRELVGPDAALRTDQFCVLRSVRCYQLAIRRAHERLCFSTMLREQVRHGAVPLVASAKGIGGKEHQGLVVTGWCVLLGRSA
jgi:hypothetical protein